MKTNSSSSSSSCDNNKGGGVVASLQARIMKQKKSSRARVGVLPDAIEEVDDEGKKGVLRRGGRSEESAPEESSSRSRGEGSGARNQKTMSAATSNQSSESTVDKKTPQSSSPNGDSRSSGRRSYTREINPQSHSWNHWGSWIDEIEASPPSRNYRNNDDEDADEEEEDDLDGSLYHILDDHIVGASGRGGGESDDMLNYLDISDSKRLTLLDVLEKDELSLSFKIQGE